jgi:ribosomal protein S18 acetylase RimI-like enzyme
MNNDSSFPFKIIPAGLSDLAQLRVIEQTCFPQDAWPLLELIAVLCIPGLTRLKAVIGDKMVGFAGCEVKHLKGEGWITTIGVLPEYRRTGIASALLDECERQIEMPLIKLSVRKSNISAQKLYFERGYHLNGVWKSYYEGGEDALILEKRREIVDKK